LKSLLEFFGFMLFAMLALMGVVLILVYFDLTNLDAQTITINGTPLIPSELGAEETLVNSPPKVEWTNPLEAQPLPTLTIVPPATPTPLPPLDPIVYRTEVLVRARSFATALDSFIAANDRFAQDNTLVNDTAWRAEMSAILEQVSLTGRALSEIGPPPIEYQTIDALLKRVGPEAQGLQENYTQAMETGDPQYFNAASENFIRIREYLYQAFEEMAKAGWPME
jgi:hypothetical protein